MHQAVEGAQVGTSNFTFRRGDDVVRGRDIPDGLVTVLSGHIHRAQVLDRDLRQRPLAAPVVYPGSVERTSFAERLEDKGYQILTIGLSGSSRASLLEVSFVRLPARPMVPLSLELNDSDLPALLPRLKDRLRLLDPDSVVRVELRGGGSAGARRILTAALLRDLAPPTMNIDLVPERRRRG
jgi:DNA repair exonuclease SbcCD nuclease subunit